MSDTFEPHRIISSQWFLEEVYLEILKIKDLRSLSLVNQSFAIAIREFLSNEKRRRALLADAAMYYMCVERNERQSKYLKRLNKLISLSDGRFLVVSNLLSGDLYDCVLEAMDSGLCERSSDSLKFENYYSPHCNGRCDCGECSSEDQLFFDRLDLCAQREDSGLSCEKVTKGKSKSRECKWELAVCDKCKNEEKKKEELLIGGGSIICFDCIKTRPLAFLRWASYSNYGYDGNTEYIMKENKSNVKSLLKHGQAKKDCIEMLRKDLLDGGRKRWGTLQLPSHRGITSNRFRLVALLPENASITLKKRKRRERED